MDKRRGTLIALAPIFPRGSDLSRLLIEDLGADEALRIGRCVLRKITNMAHREAYALRCIANAKRRKELEDWLDKHPPYADYVDLDELREIPTEEIRARNREIRKCEAEIAALKGDAAGFDMLADAAGQERAIAMHQELVNGLGVPMTFAIAKRVNLILLKASTARQPEAYVTVCIRNERARLAKQKNVGC